MNATIQSSILSDGTQIFAASVRNSVIGIRSIIEKGTVIENTVIIGADYYETDLEKEANRKQKIPNVGIGENTVVRNAIVDKNCRIGSNVRILNEGQIQNREEAVYTIVDGIVCVHKNGVIPDNSII
jgi:glucose-1-phosphate adenylyltransferase